MKNLFLKIISTGILNLILAGCLLWISTGCRSSRASHETIEIKGSDTLVQITTAWAETYTTHNSRVMVNASGGGSGTGIAALINGTIDIASSSREIKPREREEIITARGKAPVEFVIGYDALAVYVHPSNPVTRLSIEELQHLWSENGDIERWDQLDRQLAGKVVLIGRQNSSGTYDYFREIVCNQDEQGRSREFRAGISELNGSSEVIEQIGRSRLALGYTGMGYKNHHVKWLALSKKKGQPGVFPSIETARTGDYPLARKLYLYTVGEPDGETRKFLDWALSSEGQAIVAQEGFVPRW